MPGEQSAPLSLVRLSRATLGEEEKEALAAVIDVGYLGMGEDVRLFENELRAYLDTDLAVACVATGTAALHLAVECLDITDGDEVLVPAITFVASFQAVAAAGATPVACDVTADRVFIDLVDAERRLTPRTKAIMPVHFASDSSRMSEVYDFARTFGLRVIEDAAHGFGSTREGRKVGSSGDVVCFSFDGIKNITCGEGGAVVTGDAELAQRIRDARLLGVERDTEKRYKGERSWVFDVRHRGYRYHMSNLMAAIGRVQLKKVERFSAHRRRCAERYLQGLRDVPGVRMLELDYDHIVPHIFVIRVPAGERERVQATLRDRRIESGIHYPANHVLTRFRADYSLPVSEQLSEELMTLPLHASLTDDDQDRVIEALTAAARRFDLA